MYKDMYKAIFMHSNLQDAPQLVVRDGIPRSLWSYPGNVKLHPLSHEALSRSSFPAQAHVWMAGGWVAGNVPRSG